MTIFKTKLFYLHQKPAFHRYEYLNSRSLVPQTDQYDALWLKKQKQTNQNKFTKQKQKGNKTKQKTEENKTKKETDFLLGSWRHYVVL